MHEVNLIWERRNVWSGVARVLSPQGRFGEETTEDLLKEWRMGHPQELILDFLVIVSA